MTLATEFLKDRDIDLDYMLDPDSWRKPPIGDMLDEIKIRSEYIQRFGFAVLTPATVELLKAYQPLVEIGCGSGYWSYELQKAGIDVVATEPYPEKSGAYRDARWKMFTAAEIIHGPAAAKKYPGRTLLMVWPDYEVNWPAETLAGYAGRHVIYVGEGEGGCTGDDRYHRRLDRDFECLKVQRIPNFFGIHDKLHIYQRKEKTNGRNVPSTT